MNKIDTPANSDQSVIHCALESHSYLQWSTPQAWDTSTLTRGIVLNGRFALERLLGSGGMGEVWLGRDRVLGRQIAAKLIRPLDPTLRERTRMEGSLREAFIDEARIGASLAHPAIATVLDFGFFEGEPFIIFEYMDGETLRDYIARRGAIPLADARLIIGPLAQALDFAHAHHIVHRDLKPENIRSTRQGHFKILDLGLAKEFRAHIDWQRFAGTPAYTSPEQAGGHPCDGRADQYCLSLIAYEMVVGQRPFISDDWRRLLQMHMERPPPSPRPYVPENVSFALLKALSKDPTQRFTTCADFAVAFGCQTLTEGTWTPRILRLTSARPTLLGIGSANRVVRGAVVGATAEHICILYREEIRVLPMGCIFEATTHGLCGLQIRYMSNHNESSEKLEFWSPRTSREWKNLLQPLIAASKINAEALGGAVDIRPRLIQTSRRAHVRHQVLGSVDYQASGSVRASLGIEMQATLLGANGMSDIQRERIFRLGRRLHRLSGIAIRTLDQEGREEIAARAEHDDIVALANRKFVVLGALLALTGPTLLLYTNKYAFLGAEALMLGWPIAATLLLRWLTWPQILKPAAVTIVMATLCGPSAYSPETGSAAPTIVVLIDRIVALVALVYALRLAVRAWKCFARYAVVAPSPVAWRLRARQVVGYAMWGALIFWSLILLGNMNVKPGQIGKVDRTRDDADVTLDTGLFELGKGGGDHAISAEHALQESVALWSSLVSRPKSTSDAYLGLAKARFALGIALANQQRYGEAVKVVEAAKEALNTCWLKMPGCQVHAVAELRTRMQTNLTIYRSRASPSAAKAAEAAQIFMQGVASFNKTPRDIAAAETSFVSALQLFRTLAEAPDAIPDYGQGVAEALYNLGLVYFAQTKLSDAERSFNEAREQANLFGRRFPDHKPGENIAARSELALEAVHQAVLERKVAVAQQQLADALKLANSSPPSINAAEVKLRAAVRAWVDLTEADARFRPALAVGYFYLGWIYLKEQKYTEATSSLRNSLRQLELLKTMTREQQAMHDRITGMLSETAMKTPGD